MRVRDGDEVALWIRWEEATNTLGLVDAASLRLRLPAGEPGSVGSLKSAFARLDLADSAAEGSGPEGASVALLLPVSFDSLAAGRRYLVEVGATRDGGDSEGFLPVGTIQVTGTRD